MNATAKEIREKEKVYSLLGEYNNKIYNVEYEKLCKNSRDYKTIQKFCDNLKKEVQELEDRKQVLMNEFYHIEQKLERIS